MVTNSNTLVVLFPYLIGGIIIASAIVGGILPCVCLSMEFLVRRAVNTRFDDVIVYKIIAKQLTHDSWHRLRIARHEQQLNLLGVINLGTIVRNLVQLITGRKCYAADATYHTRHKVFLYIIYFHHNCQFINFSIVHYLESQSYGSSQLFGDRRCYTTGINKLRILTVQFLVSIKQTNISSRKFDRGCIQQPCLL